MADNIATARSQQKLGPIAFEGNPYIRIMALDGSWGAEYGPLETTQVTINPGENENETITSHLIGKSAQVIGVIPKPGNAEFTIKTRDGGPVITSMALKGLLSAFSQSSGSATNQETTVLAKGAWVDLGKFGISATGFSGKHANDSALVAGTDYLLDDSALEIGRVFIPDDSTIAANEACKWSFTYAAMAADKILGNSLADLRIKLTMQTYNTQAKTKGYLVIEEAVISVKNGPDFSSPTFQEPEFGGILNTPSGATAPYYFLDGLHTPA